MAKAFVILLALALAQAMASPLDHPANSRLKAALDRIQAAPEDINVPRGNIQEAVVFPDLHATTWRPNRRCAGGPTSPKALAVALPHFEYLGKMVLVRSRRTGKVVLVEVRDCGPWSRRDAFIPEGRRPWAESGRSDTYKRVKSPAGIDISPALWIQLGHGKINPDTYSDSVDLIVPITEIPQNTAGD